MKNELNETKVYKDEFMILNIDHSENEGTHWISLFIKNGISYYFDFYGFPPPVEVERYCSEPRYYNSFQIQKYNEVICGHYCIYLLYKLNNGIQFDNILDELYRYNYEK